MRDRTFSAAALETDVNVLSARHQCLTIGQRGLDRELEIIQPRLMLLVGKMAIDAFLGKKPSGRNNLPRL